jgi:Leucine-rich repeat (LRR) protein
MNYLKNPETAVNEWLDHEWIDVAHVANYLWIDSMLKDALRLSCALISSKSANDLVAMFSTIQDEQIVWPLLHCVVSTLPLTWQLGKKASKKKTMFRKLCRLPEKYNLPYLKLKNAPLGCLNYIDKNNLDLIFRVSLEYNHLEILSTSAPLINKLNFKVKLNLERWTVNMPALLECLEKVTTIMHLEILRSMGTLDFSSFPDMNHLITLIIKNNVISDISGILNKPLPKLMTLNLTHNQLTVIRKIENKPKLKTLILAENLLTDISELLQSELSNLIELDVSDNQLATIPKIDTAPKLKYLNLQSNQLSDVSQFIQSILLNLRELILAANRLTEIGRIDNVPNIETLDLSSNELTDTSQLIQSHLNHLKSLYLHSNGISRMGKIESMRHLKFLTISFNPLSDVSGFLQSDLPNFSKLKLSPTMGHLKEDLWAHFPDLRIKFENR